MLLIPMRLVFDNSLLLVLFVAIIIVNGNGSKERLQSTVVLFLCMGLLGLWFSLGLWFGLGLAATFGGSRCRWQLFGRLAAAAAACKTVAPFSPYHDLIEFE